MERQPPGGPPARLARPAGWALPGTPAGDTLKRMTTRRRWLFRLLTVGAGVLLLPCGCATHGSGGGGEPPLRVGMTPNYPPLAYRQGDLLTGLEADFARALGERLGRPVKFVELDWERLIPALEAGRIDIIMSGMSMTDMRRLRVAFTEPYLRVGQMILVRVEDLERYRYPQVIQTSRARIGVEKATTGDLFVQRRCPRAQRVPFASADEAAWALRRGRIDVLLHDAPTVWRLAARYETDGLIGRFTPLTEEYLSWAVARTNPGLHEQVDAVLQDWKATGELDRVLERWLPSAAL